MISELYDIIVERKVNPKEGSYTNKLLDGNMDALLQKIGEEAVEVILAAKGQGNQRLVEEVSDLFYHTLVVLVRQGVTLAEVEAELKRRHLTPRPHEHLLIRHGRRVARVTRLSPGVAGDRPSDGAGVGFCRRHPNGG